MKLSIGDKVYYCGRGPCIVNAIVHKVICGASAKFYSFTVLDNTATEILIPLNNLSNSQLRFLLSRHEIPNLLNRLKSGSGTVKDVGTRGNWQQREVASSKVFNSGSAFDLADLVELLMHSSRIRTLAADERDALYRARQLLICEIAEVMNESKSTAESRIDKALTSDRNIAATSGATRKRGNRQTRRLKNPSLRGRNLLSTEVK